MSAPRNHFEERIENLLVDQAICGLDADQERELLALTDNRIEAEQLAFMQTAALVQLGMLDLERSNPEPRAGGAMPMHLRKRILAAARPGRAAAEVVPIGGRQQSAAAAPAAAGTAATAGGLGFRDLGWGLAAALAVALVLVRGEPGGNTAEAGISAQLAAAPDLVTVPWQPTDNPAFAAVSGEVQWSDSQQAGLMTLRGLPANNPTEAQYQLWIIDPERSPQPVDGGVFDIPQGAAETTVRIDAKLRVDEPTTFAITLEQPGGVVVSAGPLLVVATTRT
ncbi:MAG: anti-sigma factor [Gammaproteobacteria bacterium]|jgi:anti-sigma-K factor RskA|nr:anti-sigma factor [Gammaproteobacteria bacterium]